MEQYNVTGMSCAACVSRVEKAVSKLEGVSECSVSLLTNSMQVSGNASPDSIIEAVQNAGYGASLKGKKKSAGEERLSLEDKETPVLRTRLISSLIFLLPLMYISMGHMMWNFPIPEFLEGNPLSFGLCQLLLTVIVMVINQKFYRSGFKSLLHGSPNMDTLVALGSGASFIYSTAILFIMSDKVMKGQTEQVPSLLHEFYFEGAAMIVTLITVGKMLEAHSKGKTTSALKALMDLAPETVNVIRDGKEINVPLEDLSKDEIFVVRPGEKIPSDGIIIEGTSAINEAAITGESIPRDVMPGDSVTGATINQSGFLKCKATGVGEDSTLSKIIKLVSEASSTKAPVAKIADKVSGIFVPSVIAIAVITTICWLLSGSTIGFALARGISVLVISCPCALGLATPVAIMVSNGAGARNGILFKTASSLEAYGKTQIVALDKTGTITKGEPKVTDIIPEDGKAESEILKWAYSIESKSEHPLAKAVCAFAESRNIVPEEISDFREIPGLGLESKEILTGNTKFVSGKIPLSQETISKINDLSQKGKTPLLFVRNQKLLGIIAVSDTIKEDSAKAIQDFKNLGLYTVMLTGDNGRTAKAIASLCGVDAVISDVKPEDKAKEIQRLKKFGKVSMIGDGINDAPALTVSDTGVAIGAGTDIAMDAAQIVLMKNSLSDAVSAIRLSRAAISNIHQNLFWAFFYNVIGIPLAAGVYMNAFGWKLNPMFAALAMSLSSFCVVSNALRLNLVNLKSGKRDRKIKQNFSVEDITTKGGTNMEKTMKIEGMMCEHCEARVKKALEAIDGVTSAAPDHNANKAVVTLSKDVSNDVLKAAVEAQDYKVLGID